MLLLVQMALPAWARVTVDRNPNAYDRTQLRLKVSLITYIKGRVGPPYIVKGFIGVLCSIHLVKYIYGCFRQKKIFRK